MVTGSAKIKLLSLSLLPSLGQRYCALAFPPTQARQWPRSERKPQPCLGLDERPPAAAAERPASHYDTLPKDGRR